MADRDVQAHPILNASWTVVSSIYEVNRPSKRQTNWYEYRILPEQAVQDTDIQDDSIRELASTLREMLGTANAMPNLPVIPDTIDVIEAISRQSLQVASLIHEYTKLRWAGNSIPLIQDPAKSDDGLFEARTIKILIPGGLKSRINECRKTCAALKDKYHSRLNLDTNTHVKKNGTSLFGWWPLF